MNLVVEAEPALAEEHRSRAVELDGERGCRHDRRDREQDQGSGDAVEQRLHHHVPVGDRLVEYVEDRDIAEIGIGARTEAQAVHMGGKPHIDRQHPQLAHHFQHAFFGCQWHCDQNEVNAREADELDKIVDRPELGYTGHHRRRAVAGGIVEHAEHASVGIGFATERLKERLALASAADHDDPAHQPAVARPAAHQRGHEAQIPPAAAR
jgi:hypothetical protein